MKTEIIDGFLPKELADGLRERLIGDNAVLPWFYNQNVVNIGDGRQRLQSHQFVHSFYRFWQMDSKYFSLIVPIICKLDPKAIERIKANLMPGTEDRIVYDFHIDIEGKNPYAKTAIYYVNSNNGVTIFEDGTEVESVANRLVVFDQEIRHAGTTCTDARVRCVINFNFFEYASRPTFFV